jgi:hypothetical protein
MDEKPKPAMSYFAIVGFIAGVLTVLLVLLVLLAR